MVLVLLGMDPAFPIDAEHLLQFLLRLLTLVLAECLRKLRYGQGEPETTLEPSEFRLPAAFN